MILYDNLNESLSIIWKLEGFSYVIRIIFNYHHLFQAENPQVAEWSIRYCSNKLYAICVYIQSYKNAVPMISAIPPPDFAHIRPAFCPDYSPSIRTGNIWHSSGTQVTSSLQFLNLWHSLQLRHRSRARETQQVVQNSLRNSSTRPCRNVDTNWLNIIVIISYKMGHVQKRRISFWTILYYKIKLYEVIEHQGAFGSVLHDRGTLNPPVRVTRLARSVQLQTKNTKVTVFAIFKGISMKMQQKKCTQAPTQHFAIQDVPWRSKRFSLSQTLAPLFPIY